MANRSGILQGFVPVRQFTRFRALLATDAGDVHLELAFRRGGEVGADTGAGRTRVTGKMEAGVSLICQGCMAVYVHRLACHLAVEIVPDEAALLSLDERTDGYIHADNMLSLVDLVEDELIVSLPMIAKHEACPDNEYRQVKEADTTVEEETHRPFADLAKVIKDKIAN